MAKEKKVANTQNKVSNTQKKVSKQQKQMPVELDNALMDKQLEPLNWAEVLEKVKKE